MKTKIFVLSLFIAPVAFASTAEEIAFERLNYELSSATNLSDKASAAKFYFESLDRSGAKPVSQKDCQKTILNGAPSELCLPFVPAAMGSGTGGVG